MPAEGHGYRFPTNWASPQPDAVATIHRSSGSADQKLIPYKALKFRVQEFADVVVEFVEENGQITASNRYIRLGNMSRSGSEQLQNPERWMWPTTPRN